MIHGKVRPMRCLFDNQNTACQSDNLVQDLEFSTEHKRKLTANRQAEAHRICQTTVQHLRYHFDFDLDDLDVTCISDENCPPPPPPTPPVLVPVEKSQTSSSSLETKPKWKWIQLNPATTYIPQFYYNHQYFSDGCLGKYCHLNDVEPPVTPFKSTGSWQNTTIPIRATITPATTPLTSQFVKTWKLRIRRASHSGSLTESDPRQSCPDWETLQRIKNKSKLTNWSGRSCVGNRPSEPVQLTLAVNRFKRAEQRRSRSESPIAYGQEPSQELREPRKLRQLKMTDFLTPRRTKHYSSHTTILTDCSRSRPCPRSKSLDHFEKLVRNPANPSQSCQQSSPTPTKMDSRNSKS